MTNPTTPTPPVPDRFTLDRKATVAFLARIRRIRNGFTTPDLGEDGWSVDADWAPRELYDDDLAHLEQLVYSAAQAGALVCPEGWNLQMLTMTCADGDQMYMWRLAFWNEDMPHLGFTLASECLEHVAIVGRADVKGTVAVLEVLREAVACANWILDRYAAAAGRTRLPVMTGAASCGIGSDATLAARAAEIPA